MLIICDSVALELGINFNAVKSKCINIGPDLSISPTNLLIGNFNLPWADNLEYLGICISRAKSFQIDLTTTRKKFFASVNAILSKCNFTSQLVKLTLLESHSLPILLYAVESLYLPKTQITELNSWWNSVYRKNFNYQKWQSVRLSINSLGRLDLSHIVNLRSLSFIIKLFDRPTSPNDFKLYLSKHFYNSSECVTLFKKFNCYGIWSIPVLKINLKNDFLVSCAISEI